MKFDKAEKIEPANLAKNLRTALKDSGGQPADLLYIHSRSDKKTNAKKPSIVLIGEVTTGLLKDLKEAEKLTLVKGSLAETDDAILFQAEGSSLTEKALTVLLMDAGIRKKTKLVDDVAAALVQPAPVAKKEEGARQEGGEDPLLKAAEARMKLLAPRFALAEKQASENYKPRLEEMKKAIDKLILEKAGKDAAKLVVALEKIIDEVTRPHELLKDKYEAQVKELKDKLFSFKNPPLHEKHLKEIATDLGIVSKSLAELKPIEPKVLDVYADRARETLGQLEDLVPQYKGEVSDLAEQDEQLKSVADDIEKVRKTKKGALRELEDADKKAQEKKPKSLLIDKPFSPFGPAIAARKALVKFVRDSLPKDEVDTETDPIKRRQKRYVYDNATTWDIQPIRYANRTSEGDIGTGTAALLQKGQLSSNTTAGGKVLKANFQGHVHLDSGSGGMAFVYVRNDDYTVTPVVVDISGKRGGKNGNQYSWNTGGTWDYFPPNASY